jgi:uncharacterized protein
MIVNLLNMSSPLNPWIRLNSGRKFHFLNPSTREIVIEDIVHVLSRIPRFNGHTIKPYYVLQHLCLCHDIAPDECKREALGHDFSEAYLHDISSPLKSLLPQYKEIEYRVEAAIARKFKLQFPYPSSVKAVDMRLLVSEMKWLMPCSDHKLLPFEPLSKKITPWSSEKCKTEFMNRFKLYYKT